ncbi:tRNA pseudouridine(55) synthase TruB [Ectothiorhodospiraceae bacterium WFHF3C12]|nr:tRNA pseudouridine(55) synthase TruB [Ectothiorhodospiraceae bacterium WFHF3C12]
MGRSSRRGRNINGILLLDKPGGMTSNAALQRAKRLYQARKAGHTGSLDPLATGLLPLCFGEATKVSGFLLDADKRYEVTCRLGEITDTGDAEGEVLERRAFTPPTRDAVESAAASLRGEIDQVPPMYSAIKHQGERLYKLAREGRTVERRARRVTIHEIVVTALREDAVELSVHCSKGTYVRTLVEELGESLGCGAHVSALRRTALGPFGPDAGLVGLERLEALAESGTAPLDELLLPMEAALEDWPDVRLPDDAAFYLRQGQAVWVPKAPADGWVRLYAGDATFLGMGTVLSDGRVAPKRLVAR